jgi:hypothetical protein
LGFLLKSVDIFRFGVYLDKINRRFKGKGKGKSKAIPLQVWTGPEGSRRLWLPNSKVVRKAALCTCHLYSQEIFLVFISVGG